MPGTWHGILQEMLETTDGNIASLDLTLNVVQNIYTNICFMVDIVHLSLLSVGQKYLRIINKDINPKGRGKKNKFKVQLNN